MNSVKTAKTQSPGQCLIVEKVIQAGLCINCGACVGRCPYFDYFDGKVVLMDRCQAADGKCHAICPGLAAIETETAPASVLDDSIGSFDQVVAARASQVACREGAQNGGVVSQLLIHALATGKIEAAVVTGESGDGASSGKLVRTEAEILAARGAKYTASASLAVLHEALKPESQKLGVVGLPCQMMALARLEDTVQDTGAAALPIELKIGLFCTWALDYRSFARYLQQKGIPSGVIRMDIPPPPAEIMVIQTAHHRFELPLEEIRRFIQPGCGLCQDMTARHSDISVGAYEGREDWNTVIIRTARGKALFEAAEAAGLIETEPFPENNWAYLKRAASVKRDRGIEAREKIKEA